MERRHELAQFLRAKREQTPVPPDSLFPTRGRRVPGLRREEVAELALISDTYYTKLERGKVQGISAAVLDGLTFALALTPQERGYVASLIPVAGHAARDALIFVVCGSVAGFGCWDAKLLGYGQRAAFFRRCRVRQSSAGFQT